MNIFHKILSKISTDRINKVSCSSGYAFSEIGRKENQEDYIYPYCLGENVELPFYILCDGMGGHDSGEVASKTVAVCMGEYFRQNTPSESSSEEEMKDIFNKALDSAYDGLDSIDQSSGKLKMGTTMTAVILLSGQYIAGHIGDSRIYQIRPSSYSPDSPTSSIIFKTEDDSLVNFLLKSGEISEEEAKTYPRKNVITKAMQPHQETRSKATLHYSRDLKSGDYFFLCCDGILEQLEDEILCRILHEKKTNDKQKLDEIRKICMDRTRDNFTCWLIRYK